LFDVWWCQHCLQCHGHSLWWWNVGGHTSVTLTCVDVNIVYNVMDIHHEMLGGHTSVTLTCVDVSIVYNVMDIHHEMLVVILQWLWRVKMSALSTMSWTFTMKCWWSYFSDFDVWWCQHCLQCHGHSPWNVGGHTSVTWTCVDVGIAVKEIRNLNPQDIRSCKLWGIQDWTRFNRTDNKIMIFF
jgi:hypothetical protein